MKNKMIMLLLATLMILSACAAAGNETPESTVPETAIAAIPQPEAISVNMDNWQTYFELRQTEQVLWNETCNVDNRVFGYGVFLKEEYTDRLAEGSDVSFELQYSIAWGRIMGDLTGDSYVVMDVLSNGDQKYQTATLEDYRSNGEIAEDSDFYGQVAAEFAFDSEYSA